MERDRPARARIGRRARRPPPRWLSRPLCAERSSGVSPRGNAVRGSVRRPSADDDRRAGAGGRGCRDVDQWRQRAVRRLGQGHARVRGWIGGRARSSTAIGRGLGASDAVTCHAGELEQPQVLAGRIKARDGHSGRQTVRHLDLRMGERDPHPRHGRFQRRSEADLVARRTAHRVRVEACEHVVRCARHHRPGPPLERAPPARCRGAA